ncbi:DUF4893 domain-containing protein [Sphingomonas abietis]|uniref:DUF4893 domain-containing protein n=1 Tax=Sphingomonas abietis TaxID=3012344 RepID=A0ABY7NMP0_9SPHN|nr:DUF4893 domain-containing protein [Sphingomonas abietis]WBO21913.1 DUF4893 domain-containing protein [Sphingomonas abietis]
MRTMSARLLALTLISGPLIAGLAGCAHNKACPPAAPGSAVLQPDWHDVITDPDHLRLRAWRKAFVDALTKARGSGHGAEIDAQGKLLDPDTALDHPALPVGFYSCRVIKLGAKEAGHADYIAYPAHRCQVRPSDDITRLVQLDGLQKPSGRLYQDGASRMVFLGTMILGDEQKPIAYGRDADRDMVGIVQRVGDKHWRMLLPNPAWESNMDVLDLTLAD